MSIVYKFLLEYLRELPGFDSFAKPSAAFLCIIFIAVFAWFAHFLTRHILLRIVTRIAKRTKTEWDDILVKNKVFRGLAHLIPAFILFYAADFSLPEIMPNLEDPNQADLIESLSVDHYFSLAAFLLMIARVYFIMIIVFVANSVLNAAMEIYNTTEYSHHRPIKGYVQLLKILVYFMAAILIIAALLNRNPTFLLTWLGTMAAVLLLVFKDTILGFVASIQLSANNMVQIGDWIEMKSHRADGTVLDITLNTVKVQNWDKTISTVPTYTLIHESFVNWRGMSEGDGRRIKRSINIDMNSIKFVNDDEITKFKKVNLLKEYLGERVPQVLETNAKLSVDGEISTNNRRLTNIGTFRVYIENFLKSNSMINRDMTFLVRQLQPTSDGLPLEIYIFCKDKEWANFEAIQADIFDHLLAVVTEFDLRVFQSPTGNDFRRISQ